MGESQIVCLATLKMSLSKNTRVTGRVPWFGKKYSLKQRIFPPITIWSFLSHPGSTLHGYLSKILARSCQDLGNILAKILPRIARCHGKILSEIIESHVPKKIFL